MNLKPQTFGVAVLLAVATVPAEAETVQFYSSLTTTANEAMMSKLQEVYPDLEIEWVRAGGVGLFQRFVSERYAGAGNIDLLHFSYTPGWYLLADEGWVVEGVADGGEAEAYYDFAVDMDAHFVALRLSTLRVIYNTDTVSPDEVPTSWAELVTDKWRGRIVTNDPFESAGTWDFWYGSDDFGTEYIEGLFANDILVQRGMGGATDVVARGERDVSFVFEYIALNRMEAGAPIAIAEMEEGVPVVPGPFGIIDGAPNQETAREIFEYIISADGQQLVVDEVGTFSGRMDIDPPGDLPPLSETTLLMSDFKKVYAEQDTYRNLMQSLLQGR